MQVPTGKLAAGLAIATGLFAATAAPALATTTGTLSGNETGSQSATSSCPAGALVTGLNVTQDYRGFVSEVSVNCTGPDGTVTTGAPIGDSPGETTTVSCTGTDVALGFYGYAGDIVDGVGIRCGTPGGTPTNGGLVWDGGGGPQGPFDCPAGSALTGLTGTYGSYFYQDDVGSLTGVCTAIVPTSKDQCKNGGWQTFTFAPYTFKNQGDCVSFVATNPDLAVGV